MGNSTPHSKTLIFRAGGPTTRARADGDQMVLEVPLPLLAGAAQELLATGDTLEALPDGGLVRSQEDLAGVLIGTEDLPLAEATRKLYDRLLQLTAGRKLYRVWNFVPQINAEVSGLENYRAFNKGRHEAFQHAWGPVLNGRLPAASALGIPIGPPALAFTAGTTPVRYFENPLQVPAIEYPTQYGVIPPAFARGSAIADLRHPLWHLSGTASIRGSESCGADFASQMQLTLENIATICAHMDIPANRRAGWKIFLRDPTHLTACQAAMHRVYPQDVASMIFLQADICRADLIVEIEGLFHPAHSL